MEPNEENKLIANKKFLIVYAIALFSMALVLILISYLSQMKASNQIKELNEQLTTTQGSLKKLEYLTELSTEQTKKIKELESAVEAGNLRITELESKNSEYALAAGETGIYSKTIKAYEYFWQLEKNYRTGYYTRSREIIKEIEAGGFEQFLSKDAGAEYKKIRSALIK